VNILYTPILLFFYHALVPTAFLRVILYPINIWTLEVVAGYILIFIFGYNPAWEYFGKYAYFSGNIKLDYAVPWIILGLFVEIVFPFVQSPLQVAADIPFLLEGALFTAILLQLGLSYIS